MKKELIKLGLQKLAYKQKLIGGLVGAGLGAGAGHMVYDRENEGHRGKVVGGLAGAGLGVGMGAGADRTIKNIKNKTDQEVNKMKSKGEKVLKDADKYVKEQAKEQQNIKDRGSEIFDEINSILDD